MAPLSLLCLPLFLFSSLSLAQGPIHLELVRRNNLEGRSIDYAKEAERLRDRYGYPNSNTVSGRGKRAVSPIPMTNQVSCHRQHSFAFRSTLKRIVTRATLHPSQLARRKCTSFIIESEPQPKTSLWKSWRSCMPI